MVYDIAILGSGIGGSTLAMALARSGLKVVVIEKGKHPKFTIGESTIPATNVGWELLSDKFDIPEYKTISHYLNLKKEGLRAYPKAHFWFGVHEKEKPLNPAHELMAETLNLPLGPDVHFLRADVDNWLVKKLSEYGIHYMDETTIKDWSYIKSKELCSIDIEKGGLNTTIQSKFTVDASGHAAILGRKLNLLDDLDKLHTNTRAIYGHFSDVAFLDQQIGSNEAFRYQRDGGTMHHCFDGGWMWLIRFDHGVTSVGIMLDREKHPLDESITPEEEFQKIINQYPTIKEQLKDRKVVEPLRRTDRVQFLTKSIKGEGFILMPHASAFIEPLFSTGITFTVAFIARFVPLIKRAIRKKEINPSIFNNMEEAFFREIKMIDQIVSGHIKSFSDYEVYKQYSRIWNSAQGFQLVGHFFGKHDDPLGMNQIWGSASEKWRNLIDQQHQIVMNDALSNREKAEQLKAISDTVPDPFDLSHYGFGSETAVNVAVTVPTKQSFEFAADILFNTPEFKRDLSWSRFLKFSSKVNFRLIEMRSKYAISRAKGGEYAKALDELHALTNSPDYKGYDDFFAPFNDMWNARHLRKQEVD